MGEVVAKKRIRVERNGKMFWQVVDFVLGNEGSEEERQIDRKGIGPAFFGVLVVVLIALIMLGTSGNF